MISDEQRERVAQSRRRREHYVRARSEGFEEEARVDEPTALAGYHVHPLLVIFPLSVLLVAIVLDVAHLITGDRALAEVATWLLLPGVAGGFAAAIVGAMDWWKIPAGTRAKAAGALHGVGNLVALGLFFLSWLGRVSSPANPGIVPLLLAFSGAGVMIMTGWLGGELAHRVGVGLSRADERALGDIVLEARAPELVEPSAPERQAAQA